jgi:hypothetical protein
LAQYIDDQLSAELRQAQRILGVVSAGQVALEVYYRVERQSHNR